MLIVNKLVINSHCYGWKKSLDFIRSKKYHLEYKEKLNYCFICLAVINELV